MTKLAITGASGFIGSWFINTFANQFSTIVSLSRKNQGGTDILKDRQTLIEATKGCEIFVHLAYDRFDLRGNVKMIENILAACKSNGIKRLVYISSFVVYNPFEQKTVNENTSPSHVNYFYAALKIKIEKRLEKASSQTNSPEIVILQPSIVYGFNGNWSLHAIKALSSGAIILPTNGQCLCNVIHVLDVSKAIYLACTKNTAEILPNKKINRFIISSQQTISWKSFYDGHTRYLPQEQQTITYGSLTNNNTYHNNTFINLIYQILFSRIGFLLLYFTLPIVAKILGRNESKKGPTIANNVAAGKQDPFFIPNGFNRITHNTAFSLDVTKAKEKLGFTATLSFPESLEHVG